VLCIYFVANALVTSLTVALLCLISVNSSLMFKLFFRCLTLVIIKSLSSSLRVCVAAMYVYPSRCVSSRPRKI
jgi:hypothetical protein